MSTKSTGISVTSNVNVGMDEVVSVFVSQYETNLFNKKDKLSDEIKRLKAALEGLEETTILSVNHSQYEMTNEVLGISSEVGQISVDWSNDKKNVPTISIPVEIKNNDTDQGYGSRGFTKYIKIEVDSSFVAEYQRLDQEKAELNSELTSVMGLIKSVGRKERQIRGQISASKLKEAGAEGLLNDESILSLVQL